jgi:hypothetical protein
MSCVNNASKRPTHRCSKCDSEGESSDSEGESSDDSSRKGKRSAIVTFRTVKVTRRDGSCFHIKVPLGRTWNRIISEISKRERIPLDRITVISLGQRFDYIWPPEPARKAEFMGKEPGVLLLIHAFPLGG